MPYDDRHLNLVLSGGGVKGIAFIGAIETIEQNGYSWRNIVGVSAGALVGALAAAGYNSEELRNILDAFEMSQMDISLTGKKVAAVARYMEFRNQYRFGGSNSTDFFLRYAPVNTRVEDGEFEAAMPRHRRNIMKSIVTLSKEGCLYDGDYLEKWAAGILAAKGVRTFADLRGGVCDNINPRGYKVRMTAVDANRGKLITLPDDMLFYGQDPDRLEVSKAIRMSTSVPFAFKPVEIKVGEGNKTRKYHIVDGGVLDNFPFWLIENCPAVTKIGLKLDGNKKKLLSLGLPFDILKALIFSTHDTSMHKKQNTIKYVAHINTGKISFLDFNLTDNEKKYLFNEGRKAASALLTKLSRSSSRSGRFGRLHLTMKKRGL